MSLDPSLKSASSLVRHRNVLTRAERLDQLKEEEKWNEGKEKNKRTTVHRIVKRRHLIGILLYS